MKSPLAIVNSARGTSAIETLIVLAFLAPAIAGGLTLSYLSIAKVWIERNSYEALICLESLSGRALATETQCRRKLERDSKAALPLGSLSVEFLSRANSKARVRVKFEIAGHQVFRHSATLGASR